MNRRARAFHSGRDSPLSMNLISFSVMENCLTYGVDRLVKTDEGEDAVDVVFH